MDWAVIRMVEKIEANSFPLSNCFAWSKLFCYRVNQMLQAMGAVRSFRHYQPMPADADEDVSERRTVGQALRALRERAGMTQDEAAEYYARIIKGSDDFSGQAWGAYENGKRVKIMAPSTQTKLAAALGASREELQLEVAKLRGDPPQATSLSDRGGGRGSEFQPFPGGRNVQRMRMPDDHLSPWATSGTTIVYDLDQWPRHEEGCVLESLDGRQKLVRIFVRADAEAFVVAELSPERRELTFPRDGFNAYRVVARLG